MEHLPSSEDGMTLFQQQVYLRLHVVNGQVRFATSLVCDITLVSGCHDRGMISVGGQRWPVFQGADGRWRCYSPADLFKGGRQ